MLAKSSRCDTGNWQLLCPVRGQDRPSFHVGEFGTLPFGGLGWVELPIPARCASDRRRGRGEPPRIAADSDSTSAASSPAPLLTRSQVKRLSWPSLGQAHDSLAQWRW